MAQRTRRWLRWVLLSPLVLAALLVVWGLLDATGGVGAQAIYNHRWTAPDGSELGGYLIRPAQARRFVTEPATGNRAPARPGPDGTLPAVLMIHEWWGLNLETRAMAEQLAADGYVVLAPDALGGRASVSVPGALMQLLLVPRDRIIRDVDAALAHLRTLEGVDPERVAVLGFCFGGTQAMQLGSRNPDLNASVILYGGNPFNEPEQIGALGAGGPVFGVYGAEDASIPLGRVRRFEELLAEAGRPAMIRVYEGVGHAFVNPESIREGGTAARAWDDVRRFLSNEL